MRLLEADLLAGKGLTYAHYTPSMEHDDRKVGVDGLIPNSLHLSHWPGNETPDRWKADTSTEIALNFAADPDAPWGDHDTVTNDHFDTDGVLAAWVLVEPDAARDHADLLVAAAEAGDLQEYTTDTGVQLDLLVEAWRHHPESPFAFKVEEWDDDRADAVITEVLLEMMPNVFGQLDEYEFLWWDDWKALQDDRDAFDRGEFATTQDGPVTLVEATRWPRAQAISEACTGPFYLLAVEEPWASKGRAVAYRLDAAYHSWADTVDRPPVEVPDLGPLLGELNRAEPAKKGRWMADGYADQGLTEVLRFTDVDGEALPSGQEPEDVLATVAGVLAEPAG